MKKNKVAELTGPMIQLQSSGECGIAERIEKQINGTEHRVRKRPT